MRVIFLDIDGVMNNEGTPLYTQDGTPSPWVMDPNNVKHLNDLVERTDAHIVMTSSWRYRFHNSLHELKHIMKTSGFLYPEYVLGTTPLMISREDVINLATNGIGLKLSMHIPRLFEILEWITIRRPRAFVVLDDLEILSKSHKLCSSPTPEMLEVVDRFVRIDENTGMTAADVEKSVIILEKLLP